jgi:ELWxxDGT repeat protein
LFFTARDGIHGRELWKSDGTKAGTVLVKNINPNEPNRGSSNPENLTAVGGRLFFTANDGTHGRGLWKSDGSRAGTVRVKNISATDLTAVGGQLFFTANDGTHGEELWKSDGSRAGTVLVKDINPTDTYPYYSSSSPHELTAMGNRLFFTAYDGAHGNELWRSNGSRAGTVLVKDIDPVDDVPHYPGSNPSSLTAMGGRLFFAANDGTRGEELWRSNGSRTGTVLVKNIRPGTYGYGNGFGSDPSYLTAAGLRLFFTADDGTHGEELWKSDGSRAGTVLVKNIRPGTDTGYDNTPGGSFPSALTAVGRRLFFTADDGTHGEELWKSDGSRAGTVLVKNVSPSSGDSTSYDSSRAAVGRRLFFTADDGTHGEELWKSDGSRAGTVLVKDIHPCFPPSGYSYSDHLPTLLTAVGRRLFFSADDGVHGRELWKSNGRRAGTVLVEDIKTGTTR